MAAFPICAPSAAAVRAALTRAADGRASYSDALLVATASEAGCAAILTDDLAGGAFAAEVEALLAAR